MGIINGPVGNYTIQ